MFHEINHTGGNKIQFEGYVLPYQGFVFGGNLHRYTLSKHRKRRASGGAR